MKQSFEARYDFPPAVAPEWSELVDRWYQLDAEAFALCRFYWENREAWPKPSAIFLASPTGSWSTDRLFAQSQSPQKFVHTLPNVRGSSLCQLMRWHGPVYTIQMGEKGWLRAQIEAAALDAPAWILGNFPGNVVRGIVFKNEAP